MKMFKTTSTALMLCFCLSLPLTALKYKFDYHLISDIRKTYVLFYKFRLYYHASASAFFKATKTSPGRYQYNFAGIPDSGYRIRTHRRGSKLSVVTAAYSFSQAKAAYARRIAAFRKETPYYSRRIETIAKRPFRILPTNKNSIRFNRNTDGSYDGYGFSLKLIKPAKMRKYNDSFNIYKLMPEMIKMISHKALPGSTLSSLPDNSVKTWKSPLLNFGKLIAHISLLADRKGRKYFDYAQPRSFRITYRVLNRKGGRVTVMGVGYPQSDIGMSMKIRQITRYLVYRENDGLLIKDTFSMKATNSDKLGWTFKANLSLL